MTDYETLKTRQRAVRDRFPEGLGLRVHRALSWLRRAEQEIDDADAKFIFLWIAFNAAYANEDRLQSDPGERGRFNRFIEKLVELDSSKLLYGIVWQTFPSAIRVLIDNEYVFAPFWDYQRGDRDETDWRRRFEKAKKVAYQALGDMDTATVLSVSFDRLYVLRNQLMHGGATWGSSINRRQVRDGTKLLERVVPAIIEIMMEHSHDTLWGDPSYPVVD